MTYQSKRAAPGKDPAHRHTTSAGDSTPVPSARGDTAFAFIPPGGMICYVCSADAEFDEIGAMIQTHRKPASNIGVAVAVCKACCAHAATEDGGLEALIAKVRDAVFASQDGDPGKTLALPRQPRPPSKWPRRHPAYGARLAAEPPVPGETIALCVGWGAAEEECGAKLVLEPDVEIDRLRFDAVRDRRVAVRHPLDSKPSWLLTLAAALIAEGATEVTLAPWPATGSHADERLRVVPEASA